MSFVLFFRGLVGVLIAFAITTYIVTQSVWTTFVQTVICAVLLQAGYFAAVLFMIWRASAEPAQTEANAKADQQASADGDVHGKDGHLPGVPPSPHH
ncbi:exopolysaccharide production repressor protein [Mesorhizobium sp. KR2-14]|uniref:exopolysaccharide production repressor protein n=1 Tax=Mesorhizobium sp. KR2-14 TaxID=3156610 RepID=UPI0032B5942A